MPKQGIEAYASREPWNAQVRFYLIQHPPELAHKPYVAKPLEWEEHEEGFNLHMVEPTFSLLPDRAQQLFDELWRQGLRPSHKIDEASQLEAVKRHLEDMRQITFSTLTVDKP